MEGSCRDPLKVIADLADALATGKELTPSQEKAMLLEAEACSKFSNGANMKETRNREGASGLGLGMEEAQLKPSVRDFMTRQQTPSVRDFMGSQQTPSFTDMSHHSVGQVRLSRIPTIEERRARALSRAHLPAGSFKITSDPRLMEERKKAADKEVLRKLILEQKRVMKEEFGSSDDDHLYSSDDDIVPIVPTRSKMGGSRSTRRRRSKKRSTRRSTRRTANLSSRRTAKLSSRRSTRKKRLSRRRR